MLIRMPASTKKMGAKRPVERPAKLSLSLKSARGDWVRTTPTTKAPRRAWRPSARRDDGEGRGKRTRLGFLPQDTEIHLNTGHQEQQNCPYPGEEGERGPDVRVGEKELVHARGQCAEAGKAQEKPGQ